MKDLRFSLVDCCSWDSVPTPGDTLEEALQERGISIAELAKRTGFSEGYIRQVIGGRVRITFRFAEVLENVMGVGSSFWIRLQSLHDDVITNLLSQEPRS